MKKQKRERVLLWKTLGEIYKYPRCCILYFCEEGSKEYFFNAKSNCGESGYIPCPDCFDKIKHMSRENLYLYMGRNVFLDYTTQEYIGLTYTENFLKIAEKNNMQAGSIEKYRNYLREKCYG